MKSGKAKRLVMQPKYRMRVVRDRTKYSRKTKHKKPPETGVSFFAASYNSASSLSIIPWACPT